MALISNIFARKKTLGDMGRQELRKEEILLSRHCDRLFNRVAQLSAEKQKIFHQGEGNKMPELRKALARQFELKSQEQLLAARELNLRSKELLTVNRLRLAKENQADGRMLGRLRLADKDVAKIGRWIEDDGVSREMYQERLDAILAAGSQADKQAPNELTPAGMELMAIWNDMDRGIITHDDAFTQADQAVRRRSAEGGLHG